MNAFRSARGSAVLLVLGFTWAMAQTAGAAPTMPETDPPLPPIDPTLTYHSEESSEEIPPITSAGQHFFLPGGNPEQLSAHLLVVYNSKDPSSKELAEYYAVRRDIPPERILGIACSTQEEITRDDYEATVREPIISYIYRKNWMSRRSVQVQLGGRMFDLLLATRNDIWAMVLMRGVPLRIAGDPNRHGSMQTIGALQNNAAAVDSELALLPIFGLPEGGFVPNPFFDRAVTGLVRVGPELATQLILVTRLDGPRPADVRRMIDDSIYAEENRLAGLAVIDTRGLTDVKNNYTVGDNWLRDSWQMLARSGWSIELDQNPDVLPPTDPCNHVAFYLGWYHEGACGPWVTPPDRFERGAIAYHLHSFSATTVRSATDQWVGPLIAHGAAATMGCVYEPYLDLTPHLHIFTRRLLDGDYFAEAAYASQRALSWMVTVVGDPLYRPFKKSVDSALADSGPESSDHYDWLLLQQVQRELTAREIPYNVTSLEHELDVPGMVAQEGLGDLLSKLSNPAAGKAEIRAYREAFTLAGQPIDHIRIGLKLAQAYENHSQGEEAQNELSALRENYPLDAARFGVPGPLAVTGNVSAAPPASKPLPRPADSLALPKPPGPPKPPSATQP